jgi:AMMECR1 domain-containing protein
MLGQHTVSLHQHVPIIAAGASASLVVPSLAVVRHWSADAFLVQVCSESAFAAVAIGVSLNTEWVVVFD